MAAATTVTLNPIYDPNCDKDKYELTFGITSGTDGASTTTISTDDGTLVTTKITDILKGKELVYGEIRPGSATPTDAFDTVVNDENGVDLFGGGFANTTSGSITTSFAYNGTVYGSRVVVGPITPVVTNAGVSKTLDIVLTFE